MKAIIKFAVCLFACVSLVSSAAQAEEGDEFKFYGNLDLGFMYQSKHLSLTTSGEKATFLGATGSKDLMVAKRLVVGAKAEASIAADTGVGTASNLQNTTDTGGATCTVKGVPDATCTVTPNGSQGVVFARELLGFVQWKDKYRNTHELRFGRGYVPAYSNLQYAKMYFGETGVGSPLALASLYQGVTAIRASNLASYRSPAYRGLSFSLTYAFGERKFWGPGDLAGFRGLFDHGGLHLGVALQYTRAMEGDVGVANGSASYTSGRLTVTAFGQFVGRRASGDNSALLARLVHLEADFNISEKFTLMLSEERLKVRNKDEASRQYAAGLLWNLPKEVTMYGKVAYIVNRGSASAHPTGTAAVDAGKNNVAAIIGGMLSF